MSTISRGNASEAAVLQALVDAGLPVFVPLGDGSPFDLVAAFADGALVRVQVTSGRVHGACLVCNTCSTDHGRGRRDYRGRADAIAAHVPDHGVFVLAVEDCPLFQARLRLTPARNNQQAHVRMASDHTLERWIASLGAPVAAWRSLQGRGDSGTAAGAVVPA